MTFDTPHIFEISVAMATLLRNMIGFRISFESPSVPKHPAMLGGLDSRVVFMQI